MIVVWADQDGDPVALDTRRIVGVSVGDVTGPRDPDSSVRVTLVWADGVAQPFMVAAPFEAVVAAWEQARRQDTEEMGGWKFPPVVQRSTG